MYKMLSLYLGVFLIRPSHPLIVGTAGSRECLRSFPSQLIHLRRSLNYGERESALFFPFEKKLSVEEIGDGCAFSRQFCERSVEKKMAGELGREEREKREGLGVKIRFLCLILNGKMGVNKYVWGCT